MSITVPEGLSDLLQDFAIVVLREKPKDLVEFAANYFTELHERSKSGKTESPKEDTDKQKSPDKDISVVISEETVEMQDEDRTMRRFWDWCNSGGGAGASSMEEGEEGERQIVQLHEIPMERGSPRRELQVMKLTGANARLELHLPEDEDDSDVEEYPSSFFNRRRKSVFAEPYDPYAEDETERIVHPKTDEQRERLRQYIQKIFIFKSLEPEQTSEILDAMFEKTVFAAEHVIEQGDEGDNFYVIESGRYDILVAKDGQPPKLYGTYENEGSFGELALMYNTPRAATIVAVTNGVLWGLDQKTFKRIVCTAACRKRETFQALLESVPMFSTLERYERMNLADAMERKSFSDGECIIKQGDNAETFYLVESGKVTITKEDPNNPGEQVHLTDCTTGQYFGELALLTKKPRAASVHAVGDVVCAVLKVDSFERLLGPCMDVMKRNIENYEQQLIQLFGSSLDLSELRQ